MDMSKLSDSDLEAIANGDMTKVSDSALGYLASGGKDSYAPKREWAASDVVKEPLKIAADMGAGILNIPVKAAKGIGGLAHFGGQLIRGNGLDAAFNKATDFIGDKNVVKSPWESKVLSAAGENVVLPAINKTAM